MKEINEQDYNNWLAHVGIDHIHGNPGSGRYPWGSGEHAYQRTGFSYDDYMDLKNQGLSDKEIAKHFKMFDERGEPNIQMLRDNRSIALAYKREDLVNKVLELKEKGLGPSAIGKELGLTESTVRGYIDNTKARDAKNAIFKTADILKESVDEKGVIDIGAGTEQILNVSPTRYKSAIRALENAGYNTYNLYNTQLGSDNQQTTIRVLAKPEISQQEATEYQKQAKIGVPVLDIHSDDNGLTFYGIEKPKSIDSKRVGISYDPEKEGLIEVRRGVEDVSLGKNKYAQVRIAVDDKYFIKGMAVYGDNLPDGVDVLVNTKKPEGTPLVGPDSEHSVIKKMKTKNDGSINWDNPFGAAIKMENGVTVGQRHYKDEKGNDQLSVINIINEEGDWAGWKKTLSSQMLSKQSISLINEQLDISVKARQKEFEEINEIQNPTVRKRLLYSFADECDSLASDLSAAAMPRQASHAIIPIKSLKDDEIYAPNYRNGERVVLIRYPHEGIFEIAELTVNNNNPEAKRIIGSKARDAVGITQATANKLSGADFDGDTVLVIPNNNNKIKYDNSPIYKELNVFDTGIWYDSTLPPMKDKTKQIKMGEATNLIADMTLYGAPAEDLIPATKYAMVVIDAQKHSLDYKSAYKEYKIADLKAKYRGGDPKAGAATIITRAGAEKHVEQRRVARSSKEKGIVNGIDVKTGKKVYELTGKTRPVPILDKKTGELIRWEQVKKMDKITRMDDVDDAFKLVGDPENPKERAYANFANQMKVLANESRRIAVNTENLQRNPDSVKMYAKEVASLNESLKKVKANKYLERQAQMLGMKRYKAAIKEGTYTKEQQKRLQNECIAGARLSLHAKKPTIDITPKEWKAIDAGAVSSSILTQIINNTSLDTIRNYTMPRQSIRDRVSYSEECLIKSMAARPDVTLSEISDALGIPTSTISDILKE
jgi:transcriptional regulator/uncharacterized membrane protein